MTRPKEARPHAPASIDRSCRSIDGSMDRSVIRSMVRSSACTESESVVHRTIFYIYIYIYNHQYTVSIYPPSPQPSHTHTPVLDRVFLSSLSFHVNRRLVSSRHSTRRRRLSIEWRRSTTSETTTIPILVFTPTGRSNECRRVRRWTTTIARARGFERRLSTTRRRRRATDRRRRNVDDRG